MVKYKLVATNEMGGRRVVLEEKNISKLDHFTFTNFSDSYDISRYFNTQISDFYIQYRYDGEIKYLDVIYNSDDSRYYSILKSCKNNNINTELCVFNEYMYFAMRKLDDKKLKFLFEKKYIDRKTYNDLYSYRHMSANSFDYNRDIKEMYYEIKKDLERYLDFRKFYTGLLKPEHFTINDVIVKYDAANTTDEMLNSLHKQGGLDAVYAEYDLDELNSIEGNHTLNIDGISYKKIY